MMNSDQILKRVRDEVAILAGETERYWPYHEGRADMAERTRRALESILRDAAASRSEPQP
jgi:hypothetical protein